jgi:AcrR family transcriptional regulator
MPGLRERNKRMKLQRIIAEARQLFVRQGFAETTIQNSAEGVVISCDCATP